MGWRLEHLPALTLVSAALVGLAALAGGLARGADGGLGAAAGVGVVAVSHLLTTLLLAWADSVNPRLVLPLGLMAYAAKLSVVGLLLFAVSNSGRPALAPMVAGVVAGVVVWTAAHIWWVIRWSSRQQPEPAADGADHVFERPEPED